jgi:hypothetical protein
MLAVINSAEFAISIMQDSKQFVTSKGQPIELKIGINTGPVGTFVRQSPLYFLVNTRVHGPNRD